MKLKSGMEERPRCLPKAPVRVVEEEDCPQRKKEVEELMARIDALETTKIRAKDSSLYKTKNDLDRKFVGGSMLFEKEKSLRSIEVSMLRIGEEHKKLLRKKDEQIATLQTSILKLETELKCKKKNMVKEVKSVKAKLKNLTKLKDGDIKSLKAELKKARLEKEVEIRALKEEIVKVTVHVNKVIVEANKSELKGNNQNIVKKLLVKEEELEVKLIKREKMTEQAKYLENKINVIDPEIQPIKNLGQPISKESKNVKVKKSVWEELVSSKVQNATNRIQQEIFKLLAENQRLFEATKLLDKKDEQVMAAAETKAEQGRREVLGLKSFQRKLEVRVGEMEEELFMVRAELQTQGQVRDGMVAKIQSLKRELGDKSQALELLAARMNLTSPLSSQYAVNTPRGSSSNPHRLDLSGRLEMEAGRDTTEGKAGMDTNTGEREAGRDWSPVEEAGGHSWTGKRSLLLPAGGLAAKRPRLGQADVEEVKDMIEKEGSEEAAMHQETGFSLVPIF